MQEQLRTSNLYIINQRLTEHLPVPHSVPVNPISQVQVSGTEQVPPFSQGGLQAAVLVHYQGGQMVINLKVHINSTEKYIHTYIQVNINVWLWKVLDCTSSGHTDKLV